MMIRAVLLAAVTTTVTSIRAASAQGAFHDVPARHWAHSALDELRSRGMVTGYPDGTYGGKRAVARFEFALTAQRTVQDAQRRLDVDRTEPRRGSTAPRLTREEVDRLLDERLRNVPTRAEVERIRADVDQLRQTMGELQARAARLREEVDQMRQEVGSMDTRRSGIRSQRLRGSEHRP